MSGRKQHYIPQALLRGFQAQRSGKKAQVVLYKKGRKPYIAAIDSTAAERNFYPSPIAGQKTLDDHITDFESAYFGEILTQLRGVRDAEVNSRLAATAVVHLTIRSAHLRSSLHVLASKMLDYMSVMMRDSAAFRLAAEIDSSPNDSTLASAIAKELQDSPLGLLPPKEQVLIQRLAVFRMREKFDSALEQLKPELTSLLSALGEQMPGLIEGAQIQALEKSLVPEERVATLEKLQWHVVEPLDAGCLVLPDCIAMSSEDDGFLRPQPYVLGSDERARVVVMPLSSTKVLIGSRGQIPNLTGLNLHSAKCSMEFFACSVISEDLSEISAHIGLETTTISSELIRDELAASNKEALISMARGITQANVAIQTTQGTPRDREVEASVRQLVCSQFNSEETKRLESVIISKDIVGTISQLRGRQLSAPEIRESTVGSLEVTNCDGALRCTVVIPYDVAKLLKKKIPPVQRSAAANLVQHHLGRVSYIDLWERSYPGLVISPPSDGFRRWQLLRVFLFGSHYFGARLASSYGAKGGDVSAAMPIWIQVVTQAMSDLELATSSFWDHRNADRLIAEITPLVDVLLSNLAAACGALLGRDIAIESTALAQTLDRYDLWEWLLLLNHDLKRHFDLQGKWQEIDEILDLATHAERILWQFGVFLFDAPENKFWVHVFQDPTLSAIRLSLKS